jgi:phosphate transport system substrate-binding protein
MCCQANQLIPPYQLPFIPLNHCTAKFHNKPNLKAFRSAEYPLTRNLFVIVKKNGTSQQQAGEAYANIMLTAPRQELVEKAGFVSIR